MNSRFLILAAVFVACVAVSPLTRSEGVDETTILVAKR